MRRTAYFTGYVKTEKGICLPKGTLYNHYSYKKGKLRRDGVITLKNQILQQSNVENSHQPSRVCADRLITLQNPNAHALSDDNIKAYWSTTFTERQDLLKKKRKEVHEYLTLFPCLSSDIAPQLVNIN